MYPFVPKTRGIKEYSERNSLYLVIFSLSLRAMDTFIGAISFLLGANRSEQEDMSVT